MMKYLFFLLTTLVACVPKQPESNKSDARNGDDHFRRFTYFFNSASDEVKHFFQSDEWNVADLSSSHVLSMKVYNQVHDYFLVIDASPSNTSESLFRKISNESAFKRLQQVLAAEGVAPLIHADALERIYKLEQQNVYTPVEGQLKKNIGNHKRFVWTLLLEEKPELMAEYRRVHAIGMAWPEITNNMKTIGVLDMEIYLHETQAILIMDTAPEFDLEEVVPRWQQLPREAEWQAYVAKFQRTDPESSIQEKWKDMLEIVTISNTSLMGSPSINN